MNDQSKKYCVHCGQVLPQKAMFCSSCGKMIDKEHESTQQNIETDRNIITAKNQSDGPEGIGGWLLFLILELIIIGPLMAIISYGINFVSVETSPQWLAYKATYTFLTIFIVGTSILMGIRMILIRIKKTIGELIKYFWIVGLGSIIIYLIMPFLFFDSNVTLQLLNAHFLGPMVGKSIGGLIEIIVWISYLKKSKRIKNTYPDNFF